MPFQNIHIDLCLDPWWMMMGCRIHTSAKGNYYQLYLYMLTSDLDINYYDSVVLSLVVVMLYWSYCTFTMGEAVKHDGGKISVLLCSESWRINTGNVEDSVTWYTQLHSCIECFCEILALNYALGAAALHVEAYAPGACSCSMNDLENPDYLYSRIMLLEQLFLEHLLLEHNYGPKSHRRALDHTTDLCRVIALWGTLHMGLLHSSSLVLPSPCLNDPLWKTST